MIRPLTIATFLLACGSGLYLYQSKHEVQLLDRTIERTLHETSTLREQSRLLAAEWTMLNDPERLRQFSDSYLPLLKTTLPPQFTSLADLNNRLPAPQAEAAPPADDVDVVPVASAPALPIMAEPAPAVVAAQALPLPPAPTAHPGAPRLADIPAHAVDPKPVEHRAMVADTTLRPTEQHPVAPHPVQHVAEARVDLHPTVAPAPRPVVAAAARPPMPPLQARAQPMPEPVRPAMVAASNYPAPTPYGGSLLGMSRGSMPAAPRPMPVNATYNAN